MVVVVVVVVVERGCVRSTSLTPFLVTTVAKEAHARRELDLVVVSALLGDSTPFLELAGLVTAHVDESERGALH